MIPAELCRARNHCIACRTDEDWRSSFLKAGNVEKIDFDCPYGITAETAPATQAGALAKLPGHDPEAAAKRKAETEAQGRAAWAWLHEEAGKEALTVERLQAEFMPMIPNFGCSCKGEWQEILTTNPLPTSGQENWAVERHNDINRKLGKPLWPY